MGLEKNLNQNITVCSKISVDAGSWTLEAMCQRNLLHSSIAPEIGGTIHKDNRPSFERNRLPEIVFAHFNIS